MVFSKVNNKNISEFAQELVTWSIDHPRSLPWKNFRDPYIIWISEVILQQTRVAQGLPYFQRFIQRFPTVTALASATEEEVLSLWEGLGYYSRARNLRKAAIQIEENFNGQFPSQYPDILKLKGIGPYTAAAIASFAFELPYGVVDGNVKRVVSRLFGIESPIEKAKTLEKIQNLVNVAVQLQSPSAFNQAIMDFGATVCIPRNPHCSDCPLQLNCVGYQHQKIHQLPNKTKRINKTAKEIHYGVYEKSNTLLLTKSSGLSIWKGLYSFPILQDQDLSQVKEQQPMYSMDWVLTHQKLTLHFYNLSHNFDLQKENSRCIPIKSENLKKFALPRPLRLFLNQKSCNLGLKEKND